MKLVAKLLLLVCSLSLTSCFWDEYNVDHIAGEYYVAGLDGSWGRPMSAVHLYFDEDESGGLAEPIISWTLSAIGFNEDLIIVEVASVPKKYYIVPIIPGVDRETASNQIIGPLNRNAFDKSLRSIKDGNTLRFTRQFEKNRSIDFSQF